jgi:hypothetical protein
MATLGDSLPCWTAEPPPMSIVPRGQSARISLSAVSSLSVTFET